MPDADAREPALALRGISKVYPGPTQALAALDLDLFAGEIVALCGENGAGKSTLATIAAGVRAPSSGSVHAVGTVGLVHQHLELVERLRVWENVVLGREPRCGALLDRAAARARCRSLSERFGLEIDPEAIVEALPVAIAQRVELLRELGREPRVLVLDEPTAVLSPPEIEALFATLRTLANGGTAILVITHKLGEVVEHADRATVLRAGHVVARFERSELSPGAIARAMVGGELPPLATRAATEPAPGLEIAGLRTRGVRALVGLDLSVRAGEILAIAGVEGNGQSALVDAIAGMLPYAGTMQLGGRLLAPGDPAARIAAGIRTIPQDRLREGLVLPWSLAENAALGDHARAPLARRGLVVRSALAARASALVARFDVRAASIAL
ncbi:MAG: ATP-binding cassette domain-containing protein, partial [Vulcanimicrobiaceae bacterium]